MNTPDPVVITFDREYNVLQIDFHGRIGAADLQTYRSDSVKALDQLAPQFNLLVDLTMLERMDLECVPLIEETMHVFRDRGVELIVRVIPDRSKDIGLGILSLFHYRRGQKILTVDTREEATRILFP